MGQNGKGPHQSKDKAKAAISKRQPFRCGQIRASSAGVQDSFSKRRIFGKNPKTRSQSVERPPPPGTDNTEGNPSLEALLDLKGIPKPKQPSDPRKPAITKSVVGMASPQKRMPFSFSKDFQSQNPSTLSTPVMGPRREKTAVQNNSEVRSPRVHFADENPEGFETSAKTQPSISANELQATTSRRGRSASYDQSASTFSSNIADQDNRDDAEKPEAVKPSHTAPSVDQLILKETDELILDVARFITDMKNSRIKEFHPDLRSVPSSSGQLQFSEVGISIPEKPSGASYFTRPLDSSRGSDEGISDVRCPTAVMMDSARSNYFTSPVREHSFYREGPPTSRPSSASFIRSVSNEDIHGRIALTLQMIEQDEERHHRGQRPVHSVQDLGLENVSTKSLSMNSLGSGTGSESITPTPILVSSRSNIQVPQNDRVFVYQDQRENIFQHFTKTGGISTEEQPQSPKIVSNSEPFATLKPVAQSENSEGRMNIASQFVSGQSMEGSDARFNTTTSNGPSLHENTKKIFSFLDDVEKTDRETLLGLQFDQGGHQSKVLLTNTQPRLVSQTNANEQSGPLPFLEKINGLMRKGSVELAKEQIILERKLEESNQRIQVLEETLLHQRELNMRNLRNSERDLKKRLKLQKEEFDVAFARNEALINEMVAEKRILQERCDKLMKHFDETEERYKDQIKNLQQKHLDEIKRLRKAQLNAEQAKKQQWMGSKTQEIREMTVKGLEPEVQRIIQRHQQEMSEMRAWHTDELRETEERCQRRLHMQMQEMREKIGTEAEDLVSREKEILINRHEAAMKQREEEFDSQRRRLLHEIQEERERLRQGELKLKERMNEEIHKVEVKGNIELGNLKEEYETKMANMEKKHANELKSLQDVHDGEKEQLMNSLNSKQETKWKAKEAEIVKALKSQFEIDLKENEVKLKEEFEKQRKEDEAISNTRLRRMQEKFTTDIQEMDQSEKDLKLKFNQAKSQLLLVEEQVYSLKTTLSLKEKQITELQEANIKMLEERANLTSVIRREFAAQIEALENDVRSVKTHLVELQAKHKLEMEQKQMEIERTCREKDAEIEQIGVRVQQTIGRKDETIQGLQKQTEKCNFQIAHLEGLLEEQRKSLVDTMTKAGSKRK